MNQTTAPNYKWIVLSNTTLGVLSATINSSILLIALPDIFRGLDINPLAPGNSSYLLWLIMGYLVVTAVLVVSFGRLGDMFGRVRMYNAGFAIFTIFSVLLAATWMTGTPGVLWLIIMRVLQGVGGALLMGTSHRSTGDWCSWCPCRSASSAPCGPTSSSTTPGCATTAASTGGAT